MTTYLSRLQLNPRSRQVQRDVADCEALHRTILSAFPQTDVPARSAFGILYRLESSGGTATLLVQSSRYPDWLQLPTRYILAPAACKPVDDAYAGIHQGDTLRFRLRANPTKRVSVIEPTKRTGPRVELQRETDQVQWLARKGEAGGFELTTVHMEPGLGDGTETRPSRMPDVRAVTEDKVHGRRLGGKETARLTFGSVLFDGELRVTDVGRFRETLSTGIGSAKAYGFGLLSVAPTRPR